MADTKPIEHPSWLTSGDFTAADEPVRLFAAWLKDATASEPEDNPLDVDDLAQTVYQCIGIKGEKHLMSPGNRPQRIVDGGKPRKELLIKA